MRGFDLFLVGKFQKESKGKEETNEGEWNSFVRSYIRHFLHECTLTLAIIVFVHSRHGGYNSSLSLM